MERKLASIQKVIRTEAIPGADNIELVHVLGWQCVSKKGEFKEGDLCVYFEVDSILPVHHLFFFMEKRHYKVKTIKLMKHISQGLVFPVDCLVEFSKNQKYSMEEGFDVTNIIGVTKYDPHPENIKPHSRIKKMMMKTSLTRKIYFFIVPKETKGNFPGFIPKTDEIRLQSCPSLLYKNKGQSFYLMEKLDGKSATFFFNKKLAKKRFGLFPVDKGNGFGVCSRNLRLIHNKGNDDWWEMAIKYDIENKLRDFYKETGRCLAIQGEIVGPGIQKNKYHLDEHKLFCFSIYDISKQEYVPYCEKISICEDLEIPFITYIDTLKLDKQGVGDFIKMSNVKSFINRKVTGEGIVCRRIDDESISFKVINPEFLLKHGE